MKNMSAMPAMSPKTPASKPKKAKKPKKPEMMGSMKPEMMGMGESPKPAHGRLHGMTEYRKFTPYGVSE